MTAVDIRVCRLSGSGGIVLAADEAGQQDAAPVILMHGGGQTRHAWSNATRELAAAGFHVLSLDLRGHGDSAWATDGNYRLDAFVDDLLAVIATLTRKPALVGASLGGVISMLALGERDPALAQALVLVDVAPRMEAKGIAHIRDFMTSHLQGFADIDEAAEAVAAYAPHRPRPRDSSGLMKNLRRRDDGRLYWHWDPVFLERRVPADPLSMMNRMAQAASRIRVPTLLVRGKQSDVVSEESAEHLRQLIPQAEVVDIQGAGHMVAGDRNDHFNTAVLTFLRRHLLPDSSPG
ncbi:MAG: alpha/beta fold hydrolase [Longimicrobiaceae bacterium]